MVFIGLFLHLKTLVYFLNLDFERLGPLNRELNVSSRHDMHSWHWPPKRRDSRNSVCVLKEGGYSSDIWPTQGPAQENHCVWRLWRLWGKGKERRLVVGGSMVSRPITGEITSSITESK